MTTLGPVIEQARGRVRDYRDRRVRLTESDTIRVLILPVLEALGWDLQDVEEVRSEYRHASADNPVDYALFLHGTPALFVEAKALGVSLDDRKPLLQTLNYANAAGVEWRIYTVHAPVALEEKLLMTARLDGPAAETGPIAATLLLLSRDRMRARAIDALWSEWRVDREVERALDAITEEDAFIRLVVKRTGGAHPGRGPGLPETGRPAQLLPGGGRVHGPARRGAGPEGGTGARRGDPVAPRRDPAGRERDRTRPPHEDARDG